MRYLSLACSFDDRDRPGQRVLVVAHGGVVRALERMGGATPHPIALLSRRWFTWAQGTLRAQQPTGRDFEPTGQGN